MGACCSTKHVVDNSVEEISLTANKRRIRLDNDHGNATLINLDLVSNGNDDNEIILTHVSYQKEPEESKCSQSTPKLSYYIDRRDVAIEPICAQPEQVFTSIFEIDFFAKH